MNVDNKSINGLSVELYGFNSEDVKVGRNITDVGFTGYRDYSINVTFYIHPLGYMSVEVTEKR